MTITQRDIHADAVVTNRDRQRLDFMFNGSGTRILALSIFAVLMTLYWIFEPWRTDDGDINPANFLYPAIALTIFIILTHENHARSSFRAAFEEGGKPALLEAVRRAGRFSIAVSVVVVLVVTPLFVWMLVAGAPEEGPMPLSRTLLITFVLAFPVITALAEYRESLWRRRLQDIPESQLQAMLNNEGDAA